MKLQSYTQLLGGKPEDVWTAYKVVTEDFKSPFCMLSGWVPVSIMSRPRPLTYTPGKVVKVGNVIPDDYECGPGIHVCTEQDLRWVMTDIKSWTTCRGHLMFLRVVEVEFRGRNVIHVGRDKIRLCRCRVVREVDYSFVNRRIIE